MTVDGTAPISFQWMKNGSILQDGTLPEFDIDNPAYEDEGVYSCVAFNACSEVYTNPFTLYMAPQICMVTVDPVTGNNLVVWEKNSSGPISYYNIYRESNYAGIFDLLATVPYDNLSVILDSTADPTSRAYIYKITAIDNEGIETDKDLCSAHKTIHLLVTTNPETHSTQLDWDRYVGFEYGTYVIYRSDTTYDFNEVDQISSNNSTWTDKYPGTGTKYYRIGALKPTPCYPSGTSKKIDSGPYSHSMSNIEDNRLQTRISEYLDQPENIGIYPNPFGQSTLLTFKNTEGHSYTLYLIDLSGKVCRIVENITTSEYVLEKGELKEGLYFVELRGEKLFRGKIIIE